MLKDLARCLYAFYESNSMILKILDSAHQKTLWLCILSKKLRSEKEYNVIISLSMQRNRKQLFHAVHRPPDSKILLLLQLYCPCYLYITLMMGLRPKALRE